MNRIHKADIDDLKENPALKIVKILAESAVMKLLVVEPNVVMLPDALEGKAHKSDLNEALSQADIITLLVDHKKFKRVQAERLHGCVVLIPMEYGINNSLK